MIDLLKNFAADLARMIVCPSLDDRVETRYQVFLLCRVHSMNDLSDFPDVIPRVLFRWFDEQFAPVFAEVPSKKIKAFVDVCDPCFFW